MAVSPSPNDLTRQQLDELDALLQRMLSLPLSQPEPAVSYPPPPPLPDLPPEPRPTAAQTVSETTWRTDAPAQAKSPYLVPPPQPAPPPPVAHTPSPERSDVRLYAPEPTPAEPFVPPATTGTLRGVDAPALPSNYQPPELPPPSPPAATNWHNPGVEVPEVNPFAEVATPLPPAPAVAEPRPVSVPLWPLFAVNWVIEFALGWFGPLGHLLTRPAMKTVLGWLGLLLLIGAGVWVARGMGWVSWPR